MAVRQGKDDLSSRRTYTSILVLLGVAAALPLLPTGMFAGLALALMVAVWLLRAGTRVRNHVVLWVLTALVLLENAAFAIGFIA